MLNIKLKVLGGLIVEALCQTRLLGQIMTFLLHKRTYGLLEFTENLC